MYLLNLLRMILRRILKKFKKDKALKVVDGKPPIKVNFNKTLYTEKQMQVINKAIDLGVDVTPILKPKYDHNKMVILLYGILLDIDISKLNALSMSFQEMEYNLYLEVIDKYLGENYLKTLLKKTGGTMSDQLIKNIINDELKEVIGTIGEIAVTGESTKEIEMQKETEEEILYKHLIKLCKLFGFNYSKIVLDTKQVMLRRYAMLESNFIDRNTEIKIDYLSIKTQFTFRPLISDVISDTDIYSKIKPVLAYTRDGKFLTKYYRISRHNELYLYSKGYNIIRIK